MMDHGKSAAWVSGVSQKVTKTGSRKVASICRSFGNSALPWSLVWLRVRSRAKAATALKHSSSKWIDSDRWILPTHKKMYFGFHICFQCSEAFAIRMSIFKNVTCPKQCATEPWFLTIRYVGYRAHKAMAGVEAQLPPEIPWFIVWSPSWRTRPIGPLVFIHYNLAWLYGTVLYKCSMSLTSSIFKAPQDERLYDFEPVDGNSKKHVFQLEALESSMQVTWT